MVEQLLRGPDSQTGGGLKVEVDDLGPGVVLADLLGEEVEDGGLPAASRPGDDLNDGDVNEWCDTAGVTGTGDDLVGLGHDTLLSTTVDGVGSIADSVDYSRWLGRAGPLPALQLRRGLLTYRHGAVRSRRTPHR